jgi:hypothetical protein
MQVNALKTLPLGALPASRTPYTAPSARSTAPTLHTGVNAMVMQSVCIVSVDAETVVIRSKATVCARHATNIVIFGHHRGDKAEAEV